MFCAVTLYFLYVAKLLLYVENKLFSVYRCLKCMPFAAFTKYSEVRYLITIKVLHIALVLRLSKPCNGLGALKALPWSYDSQSRALVLRLSNLAMGLGLLKPYSGLMTLKALPWSYDSKPCTGLMTLRALQRSSDSQSLAMVM